MDHLHSSHGLRAKPRSNDVVIPLLVWLLHKSPASPLSSLAAYYGFLKMAAETSAFPGQVDPARAPARPPNASGPYGWPGGGAGWRRVNLFRKCSKYLGHSPSAAAPSDDSSADALSPWFHINFSIQS